MSEVVEHELQEGDPPPRGLARDAGFGLAARLFAMATSSITALVVANALAREEYGAYAIVVGINVVLVMGLDLGLTSSLARYVAQGRADTRLVVAVALLRAGIIGAAALMLLAVGPFVAPGDAIGPLLPMLALLVVAQSLVAFHFGVLPSLRRIRLLLALTVAQPAAELALVLYARARGGGPEEMLLATAASALAVSLLAWLLLLAPGRAAAADVPVAPAAERARVGTVLRYGTRIFLVSALIAVFGQLDQFVIGAFHPLAEVAPYALALKLQALVAAPAITVAGLVAPRIAGAREEALVLYRQWLGFLLALGIGAVLVLSTLAPEAFGAIGSQYRSDWPLLVAMAPFLLLSSLAPLPSIALNQTGHAGQRLRIAALTVALNLALDLALVPPLGAFGAAIATTVAFGYYFTRHHALLTRALVPHARSGGPPVRVTLAKALAVGVLASVVAALLRELMHRLGDPGDLAVLLVAGGAAGAMHAAWTSRLLRPSRDLRARGQ